MSSRTVVAELIALPARRACQRPRLLVREGPLPQSPIRCALVRPPPQFAHHADTTSRAVADPLAEEPIKEHFSKGSAEHAQPEVGGFITKPKMNVFAVGSI